MRINIIEAIRVTRHNKRKARYVKARQELLASYGDPKLMQTWQVEEYEKRRKALYEKIMGETYERK